MLQLAKQGFTALAHRGVRHRLELEGVLHRLRPEQQQLGAHRQRVHEGRARTTATGTSTGGPRRRKPQAKAAPPKPRKTLQGPRAVGPDRLRRLVVRRPRRAVRHDDQRMAHLPGRRPDQCVESVLGIHVPRRHRLQPGVAEPAQVLRPRQPHASTSIRSATRRGSGR